MGTNYTPNEQEKRALDRVLKAMEEARPEHDKFVTQLQRNMRAYEGIVEMRRDVADWTSKRTPSYAFQIIETIVANLLDEDMNFTVRPRPRMDQTNDIQRQIERARSIELALRHEYAEDRLDEKLRDYTLQNSIAGYTVAKNYWRYDTKEIVRTQLERRPVLDEVTGLPIGMVEQAVDLSDMVITRDGPCFEPLDLQDFFHPADARSQDDCEWMIHRLWLRKDQVEKMAQVGVWENTEHIEYSFAQEKPEIQDAYKGDISAIGARSKGLCEVLEFWTTERVITIANRSIVLRDEENPFDHSEKPFIVTAGLKRPFRMTGYSDVALVADLQECLWEYMNQRLDNLALINNAVVIIRDDVDDPDQFDFAPGARWRTRDPQQITTWQPNTTIANLSLEAESRIMSDIQNITGGMGLMSGLDNSIDNKTATGISVVTNLAQKRLLARRKAFTAGFKRKAAQDISNMRQFLTEEKMIPQIGRDGAIAFHQIAPEDLDDIRFQVEIEVGSDSFVQQERRAQMNAMLTTLSQIAPVMAQTQGVTVNLQEAVTDYLREFGIQDAEKYFVSPAAPPDQIQGVTPAPAAPGAGQTNPSLAAGQLAPSNELSMSPASFMQQQLAALGGANNS